MMTYGESKSEAAAKARDILEKRIAEGRAGAAALLEHVNTQIPQDAIVRAKALVFAGMGEAGQPGGVSIGFGGEPQAIHRHALGQIAGKAGIPASYLSVLASGDLWQKQLASRILEDHFHKGMPDARFLLRSASGQLRGFLSDRFRRLDSRPLLEAFAGACQQIGAVPVDGQVLDTRVALKALLPMVFEPVANEVLCLGVEWGNSDYGAARHTVRAFILRLWCLNGATMENALAQVHIGRQLGDDIEFSRRTYDLDTRASVSALKDVVQNVLGPAKVNALLQGIRAADEKKIEWKSLRTGLAKRLLKEELRAAEAAFESQDVINLPPGQSAWRASNAISWIAGQAKEPERRLELERLAGEVLNGRRDAAMDEAA
jgi:hypothetical protein